MKMNRLLIGFMLLFLSLCLNATNIPLDTIKKEIVSFLKTNEYVGENFKVSSLSMFLIKEIRTKKELQQNSEGIYRLHTLASNEFIHFILVSRNSFIIVNTRECLSKSVSLFLTYFEQNKKYNKKDIILYLNELLEIYEYNRKRQMEYLIFPT